MSTTSRPDLVLPDLLQGDWTTALICTFGANLSFFESRLMSQLAQVPLRIILADDNQLTSELQEAARTGQRHGLLNKAYVAAPIRHPRSAHGKLILLLGPSSGRLVVGSGNLAYDGYAGPGELWHVYAYRDDAAWHLANFVAARSFIDGLVDRGMIDPPVVELLRTVWEQTNWLPPDTTASGEVLDNLDAALIHKLRAAVSEPVNELIVHAPFHDPGSVALRELIKLFDPRRVRLLLTDNTSADPTAIASALGTAPKSTVERVQVRSEPSVYIHAKWIHLIHAESETLLTGSANLSQSALLRSASVGNVEVALITVGPRRAFEVLYSHLQRQPIKDVASFGIQCQTSDEEERVYDNQPFVLWSRLDGTLLILAFSQPLPKASVLQLADRGGRPLRTSSISLDDKVARVILLPESAQSLADGGGLRIRLDGDEGDLGVTWPYQISHLRGRLEKASQREYLPHIGELPEQDAEIYELLQELEKTLIIDRASVWRIAKPSDPLPADLDTEQSSITLADLDWERVRRDPRYSGYFTHGRTGHLPPTDIQVVLAAIAGRLGDIGLGLPGGLEEPEEGDLAHEGDSATSEAEAAEEAEDELEEELTRRRLPVSTKTRMAFNRFIRRYSGALSDGAFIEELGPIPATTNAIIFNHLLARLIERDAVSPGPAIEAHTATWRFLWGDGTHAGVRESLDPEAAEVVDQRLIETEARVTTLRSLVGTLNFQLDDDQFRPLRDISRRLVVSDEFGLTSALLLKSEPEYDAAIRSLDALYELTGPVTHAENIEEAVSPYGITWMDADWKPDEVWRSDHRALTQTLVISAPIEDLTFDKAKEVLERASVAAAYAGFNTSYIRVRFEGNGKSVAFWDEGEHSGVGLVDSELVDFDSFHPRWPAWADRLNQLHMELQENERIERGA